MKTVYFIDTSILLNLLEVPGKDQDREGIIRQMKQWTEEGERFILPFATIIETGNHIAHIADGRIRRNRAERFEGMIKSVLNDKFPWAYNKNEISDEELLRIIERFPDYAEQQKMGLGDLSILEEYKRYKKQNKRHIEVKLWSLDKHLNAFSDVEEI